MRTAVCVGAFLLLFAGLASAAEVDVWVPIIGDGKSMETGFQGDVPRDVKRRHWFSIVSEMDPMNPRYGRPAMKYCCYRVEEADLVRIPARVDASEVPIHDRLLVELFRLIEFRKGDGALVASRVSAMKAVFAREAALWRTQEGKDLGIELLTHLRRQARLSEVDAKAIAAAHDLL